MRPLTSNCQRALLEVAGEPFIAISVRLFARKASATSTLASRLLLGADKAFVGDGSRFVQVDYIVAGRRCSGTGGAIRTRLSTVWGRISRDVLRQLARCAVCAGRRGVSGERPAPPSCVYSAREPLDASNAIREWIVRCYSKKFRALEMRYMIGIGMLKASAVVTPAMEEPWDLSALRQNCPSLVA